MEMHWWARYWTAARFMLIEQARNRLALLLLALFVPAWYALIGGLIDNTPLAFRFRATGAFIQVNGHQLTLLSMGINAITLIVGFMLFSATRKNTRFDRRLIRCGYPQPLLILARLTALVAVAAAVSLYASVVLLAFWRPPHWPAIWLGFGCATVIYGGIGLLLGVLVRGELEGFFLIIMLSLIDAFIQNPYGNPAANKDFIKWFPTFGPTQVVVAGGFTDVMPWRYVALGLAWLVGTALVGLAIFTWKTRARSVQALPVDAAPPASQCWGESAG
jgi:ABC-2 type transport system permease protein